MCATSIGSTFAHRPVIGVRKSGMPEGTDTPAPVSTTAGPASRSSSARRAGPLTAPPLRGAPAGGRAPPSARDRPPPPRPHGEPPHARDGPPPRPHGEPPHARDRPP